MSNRYRPPNRLHCSSSGVWQQSGSRPGAKKIIPTCPISLHIQRHPSESSFSQVSISGLNEIETVLRSRPREQISSLSQSLESAQSYLPSGSRSTISATDIQLRAGSRHQPELPELARTLENRFRTGPGGEENPRPAGLPSLLRTGPQNRAVGAGAQRENIPHYVPLIHAEPTQPHQSSATSWIISRPRRVLFRNNS